jgi:predicted acetyltransferase
MQRLLRDAVDQGKVLSTLRASEAVIYQRFGFAVAGETWSIEIDRPHELRITAPTAPGTLRLLGRGEILDVVAEIHARVGLDRPGAIVRPLWMHRRYLEDALGCEKAAYVVVHTAPDGTDDGWAQYSLEWPEAFAAHAGGRCEVDDVWGSSPEVELALWQFILQLDLIDRVRASERPSDDVLKFALDNQRRYASSGRLDEQWLRLLDVGAALTARTYGAAAAAVTIAVTDELLPGNSGSWRVSAAGAERVSVAAESADLVTDINGLSAAYLGGTAWHDLLVGGRVCQQRQGAIATADLLFASRPLPRCGSFF